jgi:hypothetical protein
MKFGTGAQASSLQVEQKQCGVQTSGEAVFTLASVAGLAQRMCAGF